MRDDAAGYLLGQLCGGSTGTDIISAYLDLNGDSVPDSGEPSATAGKIWTRDVVSPVLSLGDVTREATGSGGATVLFIATATDNVDGTVPVTCFPASGSTFPLGTRLVDCSATDAAGNTATGRFSVTIVDSTPPALSLPANINTVSPSAAGTVVTYTATASNLVSGAVRVTCLPASGATFPVGTTTVACSATDVANNIASGSFTVTVATLTVPGRRNWWPRRRSRRTRPVSALQHHDSKHRQRHGNAVQVSTGVLNSATGAPFPLVFGAVAPSASVVRQMTFPRRRDCRLSQRVEVVRDLDGRRRVVLPTCHSSLSRKMRIPMPKRAFNCLVRATMVVALTIVCTGQASADSIVLSDFQVQLDMDTMIASIIGGLEAHSSTGDPVFLDSLGVSLSEGSTPLDLFAGPTLLDDLPFFSLPYPLAMGRSFRPRRC